MAVEVRCFLLELGDLPHGGLDAAMWFEGLALLVLGRYSQRAEPPACGPSGPCPAVHPAGLARIKDTNQKRRGKSGGTEAVQ